MRSESKHGQSSDGYAVRLVVLLSCIAALVSAAPICASPQRTPDLNRGRELFSACAACHGSDGAGAEDGSVPAIAGQYFAVIVKQLTDLRNDRRWSIRMEKVLYPLHITSPAKFADLAAYTSKLPRHATRGIGDGSALAIGTRLYFRACESCHGAVGEGAEPRLVPRLGGQHYHYLQRQILNASIGWRPNMTRQHQRLLSTLSAVQIDGVADYLSRLDPNARHGAAP